MTFLALFLAVAAQRTVAQTGFVSQGSEYGIAGTLAGEQVYPSLSIGVAGGYLIWQDNITDGDGLGISARKLGGSLSGLFSNFRVNANGVADQERPAVSMLNDDGAIFVWQGGRQSFQHIYGRIMSAGGTWVTEDLLISGNTNVYQLESSVTTLTNGYTVVAWSSFNQVSASSMRDLYFQILSPTGAKFGGETLINQATAFNQRSASIASLSDGRFVVVWISEQQRYENSVDVYGRIFTAAGLPAGSEFLINSGTNVCANPNVARSPDGGFAVAWMQNDSQSISNGWDVFVRPFNLNAMGGVTRRVNTHLFGDQLAPKISVSGNNYLVIWTSMGQDGSREGIYGQFLNGDGSLLASEFRVNTTTVSQQLYPAVASDGVSRFLTVWSGFLGGTPSFDLFAQRYVSTNSLLSAPAAPFVSVLGSSSLGVSWPPVQGLSISNYEVYADGAAAPTAMVTNVYWSMTNLAAGSAHSFRLAYVLTDGRRSPLSAATAGTTYSYPFDWFEIPYDWMVLNFGNNVGQWPHSSLDSDGDGVSNLLEYLQGTDPNNATSNLNYSVRPTPQGLFLDWNTQVGLVYQVQVIAVPGGGWNNLGGPRFAAGTNDTIYVGGSNTGFYRVGRVR